MTMTRETGTAVAAGHRLFFERLVPGAARATGVDLVFLHEGLGSVEQWRDFPARLVEATGLPALVYDRWGFGRSEAVGLPRPDDYLDAEAHEALPEMLQACGIERPVLVGHSDGATIALLYAARFPERPVGVVSEAAHVYVEEVGLAGIADAAERWRSSDFPQRLAKHHGEKAETVFCGWAETWLRPSFRAWQMLDRLPAIRCPVLVIQGEEDEYASVDQVSAIVRGVSGSVESLLVPRCAHVPHAQATEIVLREMARFIRRVVA